ncbi:MAG: MnhB domain-containing protein [Halodesulfurarchaeum sp.]
MTDREPTVIAKTSVRTVVPIILLTAFALLIQGHNLPGGGFIASVLTGAAFALSFIIYGLDYVRRDLLGRSVKPPDASDRIFQQDLTGVAGIGLALAAGSGIAAMIAGYPFLTQVVVFFEGIPIYHSIEVASALAFDLGVYVVVVGAVLTILGVVGDE